jgi:polar amino acid transport system substrate-binding protein
MTFISNGHPTGFDVDMANDLAKAMGVTAEFHQTAFPDIIAALQADKCNVIINGMDGTPARAQVISLVPYLHDSQGLVVKSGNPEHITSITDLSGKTVATQLGSSDAQYLQTLSGQFVKEGRKSITVITYTQDPSAFDALATGKVDAFFQDLVVLAYYDTKFPGQVTTPNIAVNPVPIVIGVRKNEGALVTVLAKGVSELYQRGIAQRIAASWHISSPDLLDHPAA